MARVFISYSRQDQTFARRLATDLTRMGADVWIDVDDIPTGMDWSNAIQEGLDTCDVMLLVVSPSSMDSPNVQDEWKYFKDQGKLLFPILWQPARLHFQLHRLQYINFNGPSYSEAFYDLCAAINEAGLHVDMPTIDESAAAVEEPGSLRARESRGIGRVYWLTGIVVAALSLLAVVLAINGVIDNLTGGDGGARAPTATLPDEPATPIPGTENWARGVRVGHEHGAINWEQVAAAGFRFAAIKASEGSSVVDEAFEDNWRNARAAGLLVTAFHFFNPDKPAEAQIERFFGVLDERQADLPLVIDAETIDDTSPAEVATNLQAFAAAIEDRTGRAPIILTYRNNPGIAALTGEVASEFDLWIIMDGVTQPVLPDAWDDWTFWLYDLQGVVAGIPARTMLSVFHGTEADLQTYAAGE
jgi:GH25 family lysozyme M1 (1,4-beta-N-acetylmuramidase)